jgi:hypothetical protein
MIEDRWVALNSSPQLKHEVWVTNTSEGDHEFQVRLNGRGEGISLNFEQTIIPLSSGVVQAPTGNMFMSYPSVPSEPGAFSEEWVATAGSMGASGQIWKPGNLESVYIGGGQVQHLVYKPVILKGKETRRVSELWSVAAANNWGEIRRTWKANVRGEYENAQQMLLRQPAQPMISVKSRPVIIPQRQTVTTDFVIQNMVSAPLAGRIAVDPPEGWEGEIKQSSASADTQGSESSQEPIIQGSLQCRLMLTPSGTAKTGFSVSQGLIRVQTPMEFSRNFTLVQLGTAESKVTVSEETEKGLRVLRVNNGILEFAVSPDYGGCLFSLKNNSSTEYMCSAFPTPSPKLFLDNYYGGVQPVVWDDVTGESPFSAKTNNEKMEAKPCEQGDVWKGVEVDWTGHLQQSCRGVQFKLQYLTAPGSPIILVNWLIKNSTKAPVSFWPSLFTDPGFNGVFKGTTLRTRWGGDMVNLKDLPVPALVTPDTNSMLLRKGESSENHEGLGVLWAGSDSGAFAVCTDEMAICGGMDTRCWLMPGDERVVRACLFVDPSSYEELEMVQATLGELL